MTDGRGNRVAFLCYGPQNVLILAGMNKVVSDIETGFKRVRDIASPPNTVRLNKKHHVLLQEIVKTVIHQIAYVVSLL